MGVLSRVFNDVHFSSPGACSLRISWNLILDLRGAAYSSTRRQRPCAGKGFKQFYGFRFPREFFDSLRKFFGHQGLCILSGEFPKLLVELRILKGFPDCVLENRNSILGRPRRKGEGRTGSPESLVEFKESSLSL